MRLIIRGDEKYHLTLTGGEIDRVLFGLDERWVENQKNWLDEKSDGDLALIRKIAMVFLEKASCA